MARNLLRSVMHAEKRAPDVVNTKELIEKIESGYLPKNPTEFKTKKSFAPSTLIYNHGECPRYWKLAFDGADFTDDNTPREIANMRNGSKGHERIQEALENTDIFVSKEKKVISKDPPIFGYQDAEVMIDGAIVPLEIKTTKEVAFNARKERKNALSYHIAQLLIYMHIFQRTVGVVLYENKNDHELLAIPIEMTEAYQQWITQAFEWMRLVHKTWQEGKLPKKNYRANSKICKKCPLNELCSSLPLEGDVVIPSLEQLT